MVGHIKKYVIGPFVGVLVGRAILYAIHKIGYKPDIWLGELLADMYLDITNGGSIWVVSALIGLSLYALDLKFHLIEKLFGGSAYKKYWYKHDQPKEKPGDIVNITSYNQSGGITAHTVNIGPKKLEFSEEIGKEILGKLSRDKPISLQSIGSNCDQQVADEFQAFLENSGYKISRASIGMMIPPPDHPIVIQESDREIILTIAPSA